MLHYTKLFHIICLLNNNLDNKMKLNIVSCEIQQTETSWETRWFLDLIVKNYYKNISSHATRERAERAKRRWLKERGEPV